MNFQKKISETFQGSLKTPSLVSEYTNLSENNNWEWINEAMDVVGDVRIRKKKDNM